MKYGSSIVGILAVVSSSAVHAAGQEVGKGGDIIVCSASPSSDLSGNYALDYVLTLQGLDPVAVSSWRDSLEDIGELIRDKVPELYQSYASFEADVYNTSSDRRHVWEPAPFGLVSIDDGDIAVRLPANCLENGRMNLIQAIIRLNPDFSGAETQVFKYMPTAIEELGAARPLQASFLFVHEWLWELSTNLDRNRRINRYLHSTAFASDTSAQAVSKLRGMGLTLTGNRYAFDSLQEAVSSAPAGATVYLLDKRYEDDVTIDRKVILKPESPEIHPVVVGQVTVKANDVVIDGLTFDRTGTAPESIYVYATGVTFTNNRFYSEGRGSGINVATDASVTVTGNVFDNISSGVDFDGVRGPAASGVVRDNEFKNVFRAVDAPALPLRIEHNKLVGSEIEIRSSYFGGDGLVSIANNTMEECGLFCIWIEGPRVDLTENTFSTSTTGVYVDKSEGVRFTGNKFVENETGLTLNAEITSGIVEGNTFERNRLGIDARGTLPLGQNTFVGNDRDVE